MLKVVRANSRARFGADDFEFLKKTVTGSTREGDGVFRLLQEPEVLDRLLDDGAVYQALLASRSCLRVSLELYFYVLARHVLVKAGVTDREVADYVASLLTEFARDQRFRRPDPELGPLEYFGDMLGALQKAGPEERFSLQAHVGNYALFLAGLFPRHVRYRGERRAAPGLDFFEQMGASHFRVAGDHMLARKLSLDEVLHTLGTLFHEARMALNELSESLLFLERSDPVERLLREVDSA